MKLTKPDVYAIGFAIIGLTILITQSDAWPEKHKRPEKVGSINLIQCFAPSGSVALQDYAYGEVTYRDGAWSFYSEMHDSAVKISLPCIVYPKMKADQARAWNFALLAPEIDNRFALTVDDHIRQRTGEAPRAVINPNAMAPVTEEHENPEASAER